VLIFIKFEKHAFFYTMTKEEGGFVFRQI